MVDPDDDDDIYVHSATQITPPRAPNAATLRFSNNRYPPRPEVHVTTDHIVMEDFECVLSSPLVIGADLTVSYVRRTALARRRRTTSSPAHSRTEALLETSQRSSLSMQSEVYRSAQDSRLPSLLTIRCYRCPISIRTQNAR